MPNNYTKDVVTDGTGTLIMSIDSKNIDSILISPSQDIYFGFGDLGQAKFPLLANSSLTISHDDFKSGSNSLLEKIYELMYMAIYQQQMPVKFIPVIDLYAKRQAVGAVTVHVATLGGNF